MFTKEFSQTDKISPLLFLLSNPNILLKLLFHGIFLNALEAYTLSSTILTSNGIGHHDILYLC